MSRTARRLTALLAVLLGTLTLLAPTVAHAQGAWWWTGSRTSRCGNASSAFVSEVRAAGASFVTQSASLPSSSTDVKLFLVVCPQRSITSSELTRIRQVISDGGKVVVVGEWSSYWGTDVYADSLLSSLGTSMRFVLASINGASATGSHPLRAGVGSVYYGSGSRITGGTAVLANGGSVVAAADNARSVATVGDWNFFWSTSDPDNYRFYRNLWTWSPCTVRTWYRDADGDTWGGSTTTSACTAPSGYVSRAGDCNDADSRTFPGASEIIGDETDQSCDGREICYVNADGDGYRITSTVTSSDADCRDAGEARASIPTLDCDDRDAATYPGATEVIGDGKDQSCDGREVCYVNADGDGYRISSTVTSSDADCADAGEALSSVPDGDCDDSDSATYPGATEVVGDEKDQSCDGEELCYDDFDDDGWRLETTVVSADTDCRDSGEALASDPTLDCDDRDASTYPGAIEVPYDGTDQDCNGEDLCDVDGDGFDADLGSCRGSDCDDDDVDINPVAEEIWYDGIDSDCDAWDDYDADRDGFASADYGGDDCADADPSINPGVEDEPYDGIDADCDGESDYDADGDGYDAAAYGGEDCDDDNADVYPGAPELDDGIDNDCNGVDETADSDGDGVTDDDEEELGTDPFDPDSDGDGVWDRVELGPDLEDPLDTDGDGIIDALDVDDDDDGVLTEDEIGDTEPGSSLGAYPDSDGDGAPDFRDVDSDDDGFEDGVEGLVDTDKDGIPDLLDDDSDGDGILDVDEADADTDGDGLDDRVDPDDDGDGISTEIEGDVDTDGDGVSDYLDPDSDEDGTLDEEEGLGDQDCDDVANYVDANDADGPCASSAGLSDAYQSGACSGGDTTAAGLVGLMPLGLGLLVLLGRRRRED